MIVGVTLLVVVVVLASRPTAGATPAVGAAITRTVLDSVFYLLVALALIEALVLVWLLWPQDDDSPTPRLDRRRPSMLAALAFAVTLVLAVWARSGHLGRLPLFATRLPSLTASVAPRLDARAGVAPSGVDWAAVAVAGLLLVAVAVLTWRLLGAPSRRLRVARSPLAELESVLDDAVQDAGAALDPRRAVLVAWLRVEQLLADHDAGRHPFEAPFEFAARAAARVGLGGGAMERLAGLYEWARFSVHDVTEEMRRETLEGLAQVRERLRLA